MDSGALLWEDERRDFKGKVTVHIDGQAWFLGLEDTNLIITEYEDEDRDDTEVLWVEVLVGEKVCFVIASQITSGTIRPK